MLIELGKEIFYRFGTLILTIVSKVIFRLKVCGKENIPNRGFILIARHRSFWDIPLMIVALGWRRRIYFVARKTLVDDYFWLRPFVKGYALMIDRENFKKGDFVKVIRACEEGKIVGIFPEGTTKGSGKIRLGVARFAELTGREILPVRLSAKGPYPPKYPFGFPKITIWIGQPFNLKDLEHKVDGFKGRKERYEKLSMLLMERVDKLGEEG